MHSLLFVALLAAVDDPALVPPPVNTAPGAEYAADTRVFQGIPGIERAPGGRLWATWYGGGPTEGPENYVMLATSGDDGATWTPVTTVIDPPEAVRAYDPCLWVDPLGRLWLFWAQAVQHWDGRAGVWAIVTEDPDDEHPEWSAPRRLCDGIMMNKPTVLSSGEWLLPAAIWNIEPKTPRPEDLHDIREGNGSNVVCSTDQGQTWEKIGYADDPERRCDEHMLVEKKDGTLWMLVRTSYGIGEHFSTDGGKTWTAPHKSSLSHIPSARFFIRRLQSGNLLLVVHNPPDGKTRSHLTAHMSEDDGQTWKGGFIIDERKGVSYPDAVQAPDGTIYLIYDFARKAEKQIFMATFTEEDVAAGQPVSEKARLRVVVNQATGQEKQ